MGYFKYQPYGEYRNKERGKKNKRGPIHQPGTPKVIGFISGNNPYYYK
jgi:hypothetical protein